MKCIVRGIVPRHGFDHESLDSLQHGSLIWGRVHVEDVGWLVGAVVLLTYTYDWRDEKTLIISRGIGSNKLVIRQQERSMVLVRCTPQHHVKELESLRGTGTSHKLE